MKIQVSYFKTKHDNAGFSVTFGSTGCSGSVGGRAPFAPQARTLSAGSTPRGVRGHTPWKIRKIGLSKMQFPAFPGPELVTAASSSGVSRDEREARATGDEREGPFPSSLARPLIFQQRDVWVRGKVNREGKNAQKMKYLTDLAIIINSLQLFVF